MASAPPATQLGRKRTEKQEALSQDVLKATIMTLVALKSKRTRVSQERLLSKGAESGERRGLNGRPVQTGLVQTDLTGPAGPDAVVLFSVNINRGLQEMSAGRYSGVPAFAPRKPVKTEPETDTGKHGTNSRCGLLFGRG